MGKARETLIRDGHPIQLPEKTLKRSSRMIDACILFIYGDDKSGERLTQVKDLAKAAGLDARTISQVMHDDRWEEFRLDLYALKRQENADTELGIFTKKRTTAEMERIEAERRRQVDEIPALQAEAKLILQRIEGVDPTDKGYGALLTALKKVEEMLEKRTGKADLEAEERELRGGMMKLAIERAKRHDIPNKPEGEADPSKVIEI